MKRILTIFLLAVLCMNFTAFAKSVTLRANHPFSYTVQKGDTLWGISEKFLKNPLQWPQLMHTNPDVSTPYQLYPGQVLEFSVHNGEPRLDVVNNGFVKLSPSIGSTHLQAIPTLPPEYILPFISATRVVNRDEFNNNPYVVAHADEHVVTGAGDRVYVEGFTDPKAIAENYALFRLGDPYLRPGTKQVLGYQATSIGQLSLQEPGNPATFEVSQSTREVLVGDRLLPIEDASIDMNFTPHFPAPNLQGQIISVLDGTTQIGSLDNVIIDLGQLQGVRAGDVFAIFQVGATIDNPEKSSLNNQLNSTQKNKIPKTIKLPDERAGVLIVYRVYAQVSYALVLYERRTVHLNDTVRSPRDAA